jgi:hypothetical protein
VHKYLVKAKGRDLHLAGADNEWRFKLCLHVPNRTFSLKYAIAAIYVNKLSTLKMTCEVLNAM